MTGYGRSQGLVAGQDVMVEVRCYNHRFKDVRIRMSRGWMALEVEVEKSIRKWLGRGRVECAVRTASGAGNLGRPMLDKANALAYLQLYRELAKEMWKDTGKEEVPSLEILARSEGVVSFGDAIDDVTAAWADLNPLLATALQAADVMRESEGARLATDITGHLDDMQNFLSALQQVLPAETKLAAAKTEERIRNLAGKVELSPERLAQELAVLAERMDVNEEQVRLESHIAQFRAKAGRADVLVGKELDFLLQEMNREVNTISSKMHAPSVIECTVSLKAEIEKVREQVQNVE